jgi:hypothetical protein
VPRMPNNSTATGPRSSSRREGCGEAAGAFSSPRCKVLFLSLPALDKLRSSNLGTGARCRPSRPPPIRWPPFAPLCPSRRLQQTNRRGKLPTCRISVSSATRHVAKLPPRRTAPVAPRVTPLERRPS